MSDHPISRFPVPDIDSLPDDIKGRILAVQEKAGFVPNVFLAFARRPAEFRAFFAFHDALMLSDEGLSKAERELIEATLLRAGGNKSLAARKLGMARNTLRLKLVKFGLD